MKKEQGFSMITLILLICVTLNIMINQSAIADAQMAQEDYYKAQQKEQEHLDELQTQFNQFQ